MPDFSKKDRLNLASGANFKIEIPSLPTFSMMVQNFDIPDVTLGVAVQPTPLVDLKIPGDKLDFDLLTISFLIDENLEGYKEIFRWMMALGYPRSTNQYKDMIQDLTPYKRKNDIYVTTLTNKFRAFNTIIFVGAFPTNLSAVSFDHANPTVTHPISSVTFTYDYFVFSDNGVVE
jgi:hypothetical protein